jgi:4Fe-4S ferredoxin
MKIERKGDQVRCLDYVSENCIGCGICTDICPTNSIKSAPILPIARGILDMDYISIKGDTCALCGLCASSCPFKALKFSIDGTDIKELESYPKWSHQTIVDNDACIYCQKCEKVCPKEAITVTRELPKRSKLVTGEIDIDEEKCIDCGICEEMCPADAINIKETGKNSFNISVDEDKCVYCLVCKRACPENAIRAACRTCSYGEYELNPEDTSIKGSLILDDEACVSCGWCEDICPKEAVNVLKPFEGEIFTENDSECKGESCHACEDVCPCNAITLENGKIHINPDHCVLCGICAKACPQNNITIKRSNMNLKNVLSKSWDKILSNLVDN